MRYRKKPVVIEAVQLTRAVIEAHLFDKTPLPEGVNLWNATYHAANRTISHARFGIKTLEGSMEASEGDWIITGVKGERYPCKPDIFAATYEAVGVDAVEEQDKSRHRDLEHLSSERRRGLEEAVHQIEFLHSIGRMSAEQSSRAIGAIRALISPSSEGGEEKTDHPPAVASGGSRR